MAKLNGLQAKETILKGKIIQWGNNTEPRFYKYNNNTKCIEYSDNKIEWNKCKLSINDIEKDNEWYAK
ncbi:hypothetical protein DVV91_16925 [Clostridium botulinum]|uniref:hypothetical protein n=1 Tax=Clostridium TaxID=1485 RepID=UPI0013EEBF05|nr:MULTISPECIES: hypothetical protein [Clostridium]MBN1076006.1 hypothetical protein [Clostridium botulinum]MBZ9693379.1 hypothetical protein [Clostridium sp. M14]